MTPDTVTRHLPVGRGRNTELLYWQPPSATSHTWSVDQRAESGHPSAWQERRRQQQHQIQPSLERWERRTTWANARLGALVPGARCPRVCGHPMRSGADAAAAELPSDAAMPSPEFPVGR